MATSDEFSRGSSFETAHRPQPLFEVAVIALDPVVEVFRGAMLDVREHRAERWRITLGLVRRDPLGSNASLDDGPLEKGVRRRGIPPLREVGVNHLAILVDRPVDVRPCAGKSRVRFINAPRAADRLPMRTCGGLEQWQEALDPAIDRATVNDEAALREPLDDIRIAQTIANIPAHGHGNHVVWKAMVGEGAGGAGSKAASAVVTPPALAAQSGLSVLPDPLAFTPDALHGQPLLLDLRPAILVPISLQQYPTPLPGPRRLSWLRH